MDDRDRVEDRRRRQSPRMNHDAHHPKGHQPHYRYNHYPQRSSCSYASANLSSYSSSYPSLTSSHSGGKLSSPASTASTSSSSNPYVVVHPPPLNNDDISTQSALSLYQAFAAVSDPGNATRDAYHDSDGADYGDKQWAVNTRRLDETLSTSNYIGDINESSDSTPEDDEGFHDDPNSDESNSVKEGGSAPANDNPDPEENDEESTASWSIPSNIHLSSSNFINRHRKKLASILISAISLWAYSQYKRSKGQRRYHLRCNQRQSQILGVCRWLIHLLSPVLSPVRIANHLQHRLMSATLKLPQPKQSQSSQPWNNATTAPLSHLLSLAKDGDVSKAVLQGSVLSYLHSMQSSSTSRQRWSQTTLPSQNPNVLNEIISTLLKNGCDDIATLPESLWQRFLKGPAVMVLPFTYLGALYWIMRRLQRQQFEDGEGEGGDSWKSRSDGGTSRHATTFDDVAGIDESLQELSELISYMRDPATFHSVGAQPPRGILLSGPPGSGKTLLARAIAGEAARSVDGVSHIGSNTIDCFAVCSGSEFVETYVGRGAARVRSLFKNVREQALRNFKLRQRRQLKRWNSVPNGPVESRRSGNDRGIVQRAVSHVGDSATDLWEGLQSLVATGESATAQETHQRPMAIIFIDEIDALAKRRDSGFGLPQSLGGGGCDEREQTLNQLLTEMDGFDSGGSSRGVNVIVIAATNRPEVLDPAIMRPGRFDRHVRVALPDARGREAILRVHARRIKWDRSSVNFGKLPTQGFSGADLRNVVNEAALLAVRLGSRAVTQDHLLMAVQKVRAMAMASSYQNREFR